MYLIFYKLSGMTNYNFYWSFWLGIYEKFDQHSIPSSLKEENQLAAYSNTKLLPLQLMLLPLNEIE